MSAQPARQAVRGGSRPPAWVKPVALLALLLVCNLVLFPWRTRTLREASGIESPILDARVTYTSSQANEIADGIGRRGRLLYGVTELTLDGVYPLVYRTLGGMLLHVVLRSAFGGAPWWRVLARAPLCMLLLDYGENILLATFFLGYPATAPIAEWASVLTTSKWAVGVLNCVLLIGSGAVALGRWLLGKPAR